jgi:predicted component of type VI protein secretion system
MLPLIAGQLLREAVVGLSDLAQARAKSTPTQLGTSPAASPPGSNPLRTSSGVDEALLRLFESHGRVQGGPVDSLRDVLQEAKDHEAAVRAGLQAGLEAILAQLSPDNVAGQFGPGAPRQLAPGQDPAAKYWEYYSDLHRMLSQHAVDGLPHVFTEAFALAYARTRDELRSGRRERNGGT